jgi:hypothetical protein
MFKSSLTSNMESTPKKRKLNQDEILNTPSTKRSRKELTLKQKYDLVQEAEKKELGIKFGIGMKIGTSNFPAIRWKL